MYEISKGGVLQGKELTKCLEKGSLNHNITVHLWNRFVGQRVKDSLEPQDSPPTNGSDLLSSFPVRCKEHSCGYCSAERTALEDCGETGGGGSMLAFCRQHWKWRSSHLTLAEMKHSSCHICFFIFLFLWALEAETNQQSKVYIVVQSMTTTGKNSGWD